MLLTAQRSWGVADHVGMPSWIVPLCAVVFGLPPILTGFFAVRQVLRITAGRFSVLWAQLPLAVVPLATSIASFFLAAGLADPASYDHLRTEEATPAGMAAGAILLAVLGHGFVWGCTHVYAAAFVREPEMTRYPAAEIERMEALFRRTPGRP